MSLPLEPLSTIEKLVWVWKVWLEVVSLNNLIFLLIFSIEGSWRLLLSMNLFFEGSYILLLFLMLPIIKSGAIFLFGSYCIKHWTSLSFVKELWNSFALSEFRWVIGYNFSLLLVKPLDYLKETLFLFRNSLDICDY